MITTIQLNENVKKSLDRLKENKETYEQVIVKMIKLLEKQRRHQQSLLIEQCKEMYEDDLKIAKEWESTTSSPDWEW
jgi:predicted CopG family antitoxin